MLLLSKIPTSTFFAIILSYLNICLHILKPSSKRHALIFVCINKRKQKTNKGCSVRKC